MALVFSRDFPNEKIDAMYFRKWGEGTLDVDISEIIICNLSGYPCEYVMGNNRISKKMKIAVMNYSKITDIIINDDEINLASIEKLTLTFCWS